MAGNPTFANGSAPATMPVRSSSVALYELFFSHPVARVYDEGPIAEVETMRTLLGAVALFLLVAPGCGDDTTSGPDLAAVADLSVGADMTKYVCGNAFQCGSNCFNRADQQACALGCAAPLNSVSKPKFLA